MERPTGHDGVEGIGGDELLERNGLKELPPRRVRVDRNHLVA
jgi:hypothetical protein